MTADPSAAQHTRTAVALLAAGGVDAAHAKILEAVRADPELAFAHFVHGTILQRLARYEEALLAYGRAAMVDDALWHADRATCLSRLGRHREALAAADEAVRLAPADAIVWYRQGAALVRAGQPKPGTTERKLLKRGEAAFKRAIELDPEASMPRLDLAALYLHSDVKAAQLLINEAIALKFGDPRIHFLAAELALRAGRLEEAASHADIVVSAWPESTEAMSLLLRIGRARRNPLYNLAQRFGWLIMGGRSRHLVLGGALGLAAAMAGVSRAQGYAFVALLGAVALVWTIYSQLQVKRVIAKPKLSPDF